ncbi:hypothetical protein ColLi_03835 [Colletotrichum liriopes]|uniref:Uncharacterized protein n=1 Tax=Colletotrichum liriopes TaxID=708192 RepID=A0AA37LQX0_9PEZI|nr:hypothetical protein ColLi_03835 [Colletotrichum liriopes]
MAIAVTNGVNSFTSCSVAGLERAESRPPSRRERRMELGTHVRESSGPGTLSKLQAATVAWLASLDGCEHMLDSAIAGEHKVPTFLDR